MKYHTTDLFSIIFMIFSIKRTLQKAIYSHPKKKDSKAIQLFSVDLVDELNMQSKIDVYNRSKSVNSSFTSVILEKELERERKRLTERERDPHAECVSNNQTTKYHH